MNERQRIELRVHEILDAGEGTWVDFKLELGDNHRKSARQIAALANAARGDEIAWLVGVRNDGSVAGVGDAEHADWWRQVQKQFDEVSPDLTDIVVPRPEGPVLGLFFATDRAPFSVRTGDQGCEFEVPWRDGTRTRTARRHELLRVLAPVVAAPSVEIISANLVFSNWRSGSGEDESEDSGVRIDAYVHAFVDCSQPVSFARHRQRLRMSLPGLPTRRNLRLLWHVESAEPSSKKFLRLPYRSGTVHVAVPSEVSAHGWFEGPVGSHAIELFRQQADAELEIILQPARSARVIRCNLLLASRSVEFPSEIARFEWSAVPLGEEIG